MQKTKLGVTVGMLGAAIYLAGLFNGLLTAVVLAGYVLLFEENAWLKKNAVKAVAVSLVFSLIVTVLNFIPDFINIINEIFLIFGGNFRIAIISNVISVIVAVINFVQKVLFVILGIKSINQSTITVPVVDSLIEKYM